MVLQRTGHLVGNTRPGASGRDLGGFRVAHSGEARSRQGDVRPCVRAARTGEPQMNDRTFRLTLPATDLDAFAQACQNVDWRAIDTGERIMTEEGPDGDAVLLVSPAKTGLLRVAVMQR